MTISDQTPIAEIMAACPNSIRLLIDHHAGCPGCSMSAFCSLADVCHNHAIDLEPFLARLRPD